ncbi:peptidylprolyl isomerase [Clavibacter michiganensis]|uniref:peptidylprolyl isomerase n=1 Tax=Clavibacter michiganensis TaxID=28447 RepID=A0A2S5VVN8_9MICO|nr:peptidylprolyl isomerase [Clavibacter michiganensis]PPF69300.1 peptidylprolyl isomerase [Clavibacter michiganensis]
MAPRNDRAAREAQARLRRYAARRELHARAVRRRRRDDLVAVVGVVLVAALAVGAQLAWQAGPGAPEPAASASPTPDAATPTADPADTQDLPPATLAEDRTWTGSLVLNGDVALGVELDGRSAPQSVSVLVSLAQSGWYADRTCHRLTTALFQCGSADGQGGGDAGFTYGPVEDAPEDGAYPAGTIAMARGESPDSQSGQFFVVYRDTRLDTSTGGYTVVGRVTSGLDDYVARIADQGITPGASAEDGAPVVPTTITSLTLG